MLYTGAEYCPYCAAERWALTVALSKFGSFSNLQLMHSSPTDRAAKNVPTLSYLTFTPIELEDRNGKVIEKPSTADYNLLMAQGGSYPFIDFGGKFIQSNASVDTSVLQAKKQTDIAASLSKSNATASQVNSAAGGFIKAICTLTKGQPGNVCNAMPG